MKETDINKWTTLLIDFAIYCDYFHCSLCLY